MKINILLPHKEIFDKNLASSVSITVKNNMQHSNYKKNIRVFGVNCKDPIYPEHFVGIKDPINFFASKNKNLAKKMIEFIQKDICKHQLIEIHNRPYLFNLVRNKLPNYPISLFFHNDPNTMMGSKSVKEKNYLIKNAKYIFCVSDFIKNKFLENINYTHNNVKVIHNGIDRKIKKFPDKKRTILFVGRIVKEKGVTLFVESCKKLANVYPSWNFGIIGSTKLGFKNIKTQFEEEITKDFLGIGKQATIYGFMSYEEVQTKMSEASIVIIPSIWEEPYGLVVAEAMSNGCAVICSKIGGIPEIINDKGIVIEKIDHFKIIKAASKLMSNPKYLSQMQKLSWNNFQLTSKASSTKLDSFRAQIII